ncbi:hypothetical protein HZC27_02170 [Candidatus Roizmanbacteria bacterium]|nr:hypothetical protein [Candidatus Roizmanbacteria bacterium]
MDSFLFAFFLFIIAIPILYAVSRYMLTELFLFLHLFIRRRDLIFSTIAVIFLPGTILHELSHYLTATILFLQVGEVHIMPSWKENHLQLGRVTYRKADVVRSIIVGVAPFFGALFFFWFVGAFHLFPSVHIAITLFFGYLLFSVSANMFSSKQDLIDLIYVIPICLIAGAVFYITNVKIFVSIPDAWLQNTADLLQRVNIYITISIAIHTVLIMVFKSFKIFRR